MFSWKTILSIGFAELLSHTNLQMYDDSSFAAVSTPTIMGLNNKKSVCQTNSSIQIKINGMLTLPSFWHYQVDVVFRATYFINWMPSRVLIFKTPRELLSPPLSSELFPLTLRVRYICFTFIISKVVCWILVLLRIYFLAIWPQRILSPLSFL